MDITQLQAMHAYIQQLNFQAASAVASTTPNLLAATAPMLNSNFINSHPTPPSSSSSSLSSSNDNNLNSLTTLALLFANQQQQQNATTNNHVRQSYVQPITTTTTTNTMPLTYQPQQPIAATPSQPIIQMHELLDQQAILNQLSQLIGTFGQNQIPNGNIFTHPQQQPNVFQQPIHQQQPSSVSTSMMSKPPILTPSAPIQIPKPPPQLSRQSLPSSTPENIRKRRHRDHVEMISSQPSSHSGSPNNNNNNNLMNDKFARSRAFTCPETMKTQPQQQQQQQQSQKDQSVHHHPASPDKIAKFDPTCPLRHHPDNLSPPNQQAMMLEQITTAYILNALGESAYRASDPTTSTTKDENKSKQEASGNGIEIINGKDNNIEKSGSIVKIPMSEIHRMIEDCYNDL